jgi:hypothetical protein
MMIWTVCLADWGVLKARLRPHHQSDNHVGTAISPRRHGRVSISRLTVPSWQCAGIHRICNRHLDVISMIAGHGKRARSATSADMYNVRHG